MKRLPLHHLHRLRRKLRRAMFRFHPVDPYANDEEWNLTGHRQPTPPRNPMKIVFLALLGALIGISLFAVTSCATIETVTTTTAPDGTVTVVKSKSTAPDAGSVTALSTTAQAFAPRAVIVNSGK